MIFFLMKHVPNGGFFAEDGLGKPHVTGKRDMTMTIKSCIRH